MCGGQGQWGVVGPLPEVLVFPLLVSSVPLQVPGLHSSRDHVSLTALSHFWGYSFRCPHLPGSLSLVAGGGGEAVPQILS